MMHTLLLLGLAGAALIDPARVDPAGEAVVVQARIDAGDAASPQDVSGTPLQDAPVKPPLRVRIALGGLLQSGFPGGDIDRFNPLFTLSRARGSEPFRFGAPGDGNAVSLLRVAGIEAGPLLRLEGRRRGDDLVEGLPNVKRTVEVGGFVQTWLSENIRVRGDVRKGLGGHKAWVGQAGFDYVLRDGDRWLVSLGPRVTLSERRYQRAWFGVTPEAALPTGLPTYDPDGGLTSVGATSRILYSLTRRWGVIAQAQYGRLVADAGRSPAIREYGSRNQLAVGLGATYTFTVRR